jgi:hypothetical protein
MLINPLRHHPCDAGSYAHTGAEARKKNTINKRMVMLSPRAVNIFKKFTFYKAKKVLFIF